METSAEVTNPPAGSAITVFCVTKGLPSTTQLMSEAGLDRAVLHTIVTLSPALASFGPLITTLDGATE